MISMNAALNGMYSGKIQSNGIYKIAAEVRSV
jgi:hypothetical protein